MAHPFGPRWPTLEELIKLFVMMGCVQHELPGHLEGPDGKHPIRYLYSPDTDDFVSLLNYEEDDHIPPSEVANWERRLGIKIPKNPNWDL